MNVEIGSVETFRDVRPDKAQVMKIAEETLEVYSAWEAWGPRYGLIGLKRKRLLDECADVVQATANLVAALGVGDFAPYMEACRVRNEERGRL